MLTEQDRKTIVNFIAMQDAQYLEKLLDCFAPVSDSKYSVFALLYRFSLVQLLLIIQDTVFTLLE